MMRWLNDFLGVLVNTEHVCLQGPFQHPGPRGINLYVVGDIYGAYLDGYVLDPQSFIQKLATSANDGPGLEKIMRKAVGDFFVAVLEKEKVSILTAPASHGIFYTAAEGKYIISDIPENLFPLIKSYTVSEYEVLQWLFLDGERPIPFHYIFEEIRCLMGGSRLCLQKEGREQIGVYVFPPTEPSCTYDMFVDGLEGTARVIVSECERRNKPVYSLFSGGIDSAASTLSIMSAGGKVMPITLLPARYRDLEGYEVTYTMAIRSSEAMKIPLKIVPFDEFDERVVEKQFETFNSSLYSGGYLAMAFFSNPGLFDGTNPLIFSADGMDTIYAIAHQKPPFKLPLAFHGLRPVLNQGYFLGMQYTKFFQSAVLQATPFWKMVYPVLSHRKYRKDIRLPLNAYDYFQNMLTSTKLLALRSDRLLASVLSSKGRGISADKVNTFLKTPSGIRFLEYKFETLIKELLGDIDLSDLGKNNLSLAQFNSIMRRFAYSTFFWQSLIGQYANGQKFNYNYLSLPFQGPLLDVFSGLYAGLKEASFPKWFEYRYFAERTKKRFFFTAKASLPPERNQRRHLPVVNHAELFIKSKPYIERMLPLMDPKKSALLDSLKDRTIREFVCEAYVDVRENIQNNADLWPMLYRLYQLESHVRHILGGERERL